MLTTIQHDRLKHAPEFPTVSAGQSRGRHMYPLQSQHHAA
jgi:hypothetical protein